MIKEAAIQRRKDGKVWTGRRHGDVIRKILAEEETQTVKHSEFIQGFVTDDGLFVDRHEAFKIAYDNNQILTRREPGGTSTLISEDLY
jgi:hypothetical protein